MDIKDTSPVVWRNAKKEYEQLKEEGFGDPRKYDEMFELADEGMEWPCLCLTLISLDPELDEYNPRKAIQYIRHLIQNRHFESASYLVEYIVGQKKSEAAVKICIKALRAMAKAGHTHSHHLLACFIFDGIGTEKNRDEARSWLTIAARANDSEAQLVLAFRYLNGDEIAQDRKHAFHWARRAKALGNPDAFWVLWQEELEV